MSELISIDKKKKHVYLRRALSAGAIMLTSQLVRRGFEGLYTSVRGCRPPKNPHRKEASWPAALIWAISTGAALGAVKTLIRPHIIKGVDELLDT